MKPPATTGFLFALICAATSWLAITALDPPTASPTQTAEEQFSSTRALRHFEVLSANPRPVGSPGHATSLAYLQEEIRALGLKPQIQTVTMQLATPRKGWVTLVTIENVLARLRGQRNASPLLLSSHYDSVVNSPGAGDDGFGVVTMLETLRALVAGPPLNNDVLFLFTDAEELGLLGARAFMDEHPWAPKVKMLMNFDALGTRGPAILFELTQGNAPLIHAFKEVGNHPTAFSFSKEIYGLLPNLTDFSILSQAGATGYNFALIDGPTGYHTPLDNLDRIDADSIQHGGQIALDLVRQVDETGIGGSWRGEDAVFFSLLGHWLITYPQGLVLLLAVALALGAATLTALGLRGQHSTNWRLSIQGLAVATGSILLTVAAVGGLALLTGRLLIPSAYRFSIWNGRDSHAVTLLAIALMVTGLTLLAARVLTKRCGDANFTAAGMLLWACLCLLVSVRAPGASYLFALPLLLVELQVAVSSLRAEVRAPEGITVGVGQLFLLALAVGATALLWAPALTLTTMALHASAAPWVAGALALLFTSLLASASRLVATSRLGLPLAGALLLGALALGGAARASSHHGADNPHPDLLIYAYNANSGQANWVTYDSQLDDWTSQFLGTSPSGQIMPNFFFHQRKLPSAPAPELTWRQGGPQHASLKTLADRIDEKDRIVEFRVDWSSAPSRAILTLESSGVIEELTVNGQKIKKLDSLSPEASFKTMVRYYAPPSEGITITATLVPASATLTVDVLGDWFELPRVEGFPSPQRPAGFMARNGLMADSTLVLNSFEIPQDEASRGEAASR